MKILHIITRLEAGGSAENTLESAVSQSAKWDVTLISGPHPGGLPIPHGLKYVELPELRREISPLNDLKACLALKRLIAEIAPDIIHTHTSKAGFIGRWAAFLHNRGMWRKRIITVHTPHGHVLYGYFGPVKAFIFKLAEIMTARVTAYFIALTEGEKNESIAAGFGTEKKWTVIHSGIRFGARPAGSARQELGITPDETVVAVVARLEPVKGVEFFLRAAAELRAKMPGQKLRFLIVGDGARMNALSGLAARLDLSGVVTFTGFRRDVLRCLTAADIYVQPSLNEAMGRTVIEAQYMGLPVVASRVCGLPDALREGGTGLLVPPADPDALAAAIETLINDIGLRRRMGSAAGQWISEMDFTGHTRFSAESMNAKLEKFYNEISGGDGPALGNIGGRNATRTG
jgi:glycosyltransferase involved in cell wall biosynthesis